MNSRTGTGISSAVFNAVKCLFALPINNSCQYLLAQGGCLK
jgi:hypothetical protein